MNNNTQNSQALTEYHYAGNPQTLRTYEPSPHAGGQQTPPPRKESPAVNAEEEKSFLAAAWEWFMRPRPLGVCSLLLSIASVILAFVGGIGALPGLLGVLAANRAKKLGGDGFATAGMVISIIGLCLSCLNVFLMFACVGLAGLMAFI